jgi:hypothetical protein
MLYILTGCFGSAAVALRLKTSGWDSDLDPSRGRRALSQLPVRKGC